MKKSKLCQHKHDDYQNASTASTDKQKLTETNKTPQRETHTYTLSEREREGDSLRNKKFDIKFLNAVHVRQELHFLTLDLHTRTHVHTHIHSHSQAYENNSVHIKSGKINYLQLKPD